jgi:phosphoglycolate phosphatase-like HAD superfamily hydrolase
MTDRNQGVILDVDGTLINSNDAHARAWVEALSEVGIVVDFAKVRPLIGMGGDKLLPALGGLAEESKLGARVSERRSEIFRERYLPQLHSFPKTRELLLRMVRAGLTLAVASSAKKEELDILLELAKVKDLIETATSSGDAERSKPDPDIVRAALDRLALPPARALMIGDTPYDIEAARRLGIDTIAFRCGGRSDRDLSGAIAIYDGPEQLLEHFDSSPLSARRRRRHGEK